jgi:hypothetical protein
MKTWTAIGMLVGLAACGVVPSSFDFDVRGDVNLRVASGVTRGQVDNAGFLSLDDRAWGLTMSLGGLAPGRHVVAKGAGELALMRKGTGDWFTTAEGGSCAVWIDPHKSSNGSAVTGKFDCTNLQASNGLRIDVAGGQFFTRINDAANDPTLTPPPPP